MQIFSTKLIKKSSVNRARVTKMITSHGEVMTPSFMPVATRAFVNHLEVSDLIEIGSQIILGGNTYHMLCSPKMDILKSLGGMHHFMKWNGPMLTDSGGYQVFSLSSAKKKGGDNMCKINDDGAIFKNPYTGEKLKIGPIESISAQKIIGADIMMAFDECAKESDDEEEIERAMNRTHRWLTASKVQHDRNVNSAYGYQQALFGIIQGGSIRHLREKSAEFVIGLNMDGYAIGGEVIGYDMVKTKEITGWIEHMLPENKIRYTMGVGASPQDIIDVVECGIDIFDCVAPTRNARHGSLYCGQITEENNWLRYSPVFEGVAEVNKILIKKSAYEKDERPISAVCGCYTCCNYTRAYLHYLFKQRSSLYERLACIHNIHVMQSVCDKMREVILREE